MKYEYKCVRSFFERQGKKTISEQVEEIINKQAIEGWEYYDTATADELVHPGCLSALFGGKDIILYHSLLVFRKQKNG